MYNDSNVLFSQSLQSLGFLEYEQNSTGKVHNLQYTTNFGFFGSFGSFASP